MTHQRLTNIDAHQHFWRYNPQNYPWIDNEMMVLQQDYLPAQLRPLLTHHDMQGSVLIQACSDLNETRWLLDVAEHTDMVKAVVGWLDLASPQLGEQLAEFSHRPLLRGIRHQVQDEPSPAEWFTDIPVNRGLRQIQQQGYVYELLVTHRYLAEATKFARRHDAHHLVLDHFGKPDLSLDARAWGKHIAPMAALPHVSCKLSGLLTEPRPANITPKDLLPYFEVALELFGSQRLLFGSDWPVCLLAGSYSDARHLCQQATQSLSANEQAAIFGANACHLYQLFPKNVEMQPGDQRKTPLCNLTCSGSHLWSQQ